MRTLYKPNLLRKMLKLPALIFFLLAVSYVARGQGSLTSNSPVCYGDNIELYCTLDHCDDPAAVYSWSCDYGGWISSEKNPQIPQGNASYEWTAYYGSQLFYCSVTYPGGFNFGYVSVAVLPQTTLSTSITHPTCNGSSNGAVNLIVSGTTGPYSFYWSNGATSEDINTLVAGTYNVTVTDENDCNTYTSAILTQPGVIGLSATLSHVSCANGSDGSIDMSVTGGTSPYTFNWSNGSTVEDPSGLAAGSYNVTVSDQNACTGYGGWTITQPIGMIIGCVGTNVTCHGGSNGTLALTIFNGSPPYTYLWSNSETTSSITGLTAGYYGVTVSDNNNCHKIGAWDITEPDSLIVTLGLTHVSCNSGSNGAIVTTVTGGVSPYTYNWSTGATTTGITDLSVGTYWVTVTDANACIATSSGTITQPTAVQITGSDVVHVGCRAQSTGSISISVGGGVTPYNFIWSNNATTQNISGVGAGTYSVTVTDANTCPAYGSWTITEPALPLSAVAVITHVSCYGFTDGQIQMTTMGGTTPYTYIWSNSATTEDITGLAAGPYNVTVTDANGCYAFSGGTVTQPAAALEATVDVINHVSCNGQTDGAVGTTVTGGTLPYTYNWSNGATTETISGLAPATYYVTITDNHGCLDYGDATITQPDVLSITNSAITHVGCRAQSTGAISITVGGGTTPYAYLWSNNATTEDIENVQAGTYAITVTDGHSCKTYGSWTITQPALPLSAVAVITHVSCYGFTDGQIQMTTMGGTTPYTYDWSNGATTEDITGLSAGAYNVTVTDANGCYAFSGGTVTQPAAPLEATVGVLNHVSCGGSSDGALLTTVTGGTMPYTYNWSNSATTSSISNLAAGTYYLTVTDNHGCLAYGYGTITQPEPLVITNSQIVHVGCRSATTGAVYLTVGGGTLPYTYLWSNNATTEDIVDVSAGTYSITVTDARSCHAYGSWTITQPALPLSAVAVITHVSCYGFTDGQIQMTTMGGTTPYTYIWSNSATTEDITGLAAGPYNVTVTDQNGCYAFSGGIVTQPAAPLEVVVGVQNHVSCYGGNNGALLTTVTGGTSPYTYAWSNTIATPGISGLEAGTYYLTVTDNHGCLAYGSGTITQPLSPLEISNSSIIHVGCRAQSSGAVYITVGGGTSPYTYAWSNSATTQNIVNVVAGKYNVTVTDANSCTTFGSWTITEPALPLSAVAVITHVSCYGSSNGQIQMTTIGGTTPYTYDWSNEATTEDITGLTPGAYNVTVTDANGCYAFSGGTVTQPELLTVTGASTHISCYSYTNGAVNTTVTGGTSPYTYAWSNTATTANISGLSGGTYCVTVTDAHSCAAYGCYTITQPPAWSVAISGDTLVCCNAALPETYTASVSGEYCTPVTYEWVVVGGTLTCAANGPSISVDWACCNTGTITLVVTACNGCIMDTTITVTINNPPAPVITGPVTVMANQTGAQYCTPDFTGHTYSWAVEGGTVTAGQGTSCITVTWGPYPPCGCGHVIVCETDTTTGCFACDTLEIVILPTGENLYGYVVYNNTYKTALNDVDITLRNPTTGTIVATTTSGPNFGSAGEPGYWAFTDIPDGTYRLVGSFNGTWGGNNATDALIVQLAATSTPPFNWTWGLLRNVADVNGSTTITALDALYIKLRTVGMITSYPAGDWAFLDTTFTLTTSANFAQNFVGYCFGDVNASYIPTGLKDGDLLSVIDDGLITVPVNQSFDYTINSSMTAELGAMTLFLSYDQNRFEIEDVVSNYEGMKYAIEDGKVAIAWSDVQSLAVKDGEPVVTLSVRAKEVISDATRLFNLLPGCEFADPGAVPIDDFTLKMATVATVNGANDLSMFNFPNPFNNTTKIVYTLPESGKVRLVLTDMYGKALHTLVDAVQNAGTYTFEVNSTELHMAPGVYLYQIELQGNNENYSKISKMIYTR